MSTIRARATLAAAVSAALVAAVIAGITLVSLRQAKIQDDIDAQAITARRVGYLLREGGTLDQILTEEVYRIQVVDDTGRVVSSSRSIAGRTPVTGRRPGDEDNRWQDVLCSSDLTPGDCQVVVALRVHSPTRWLNIYVFQSAPPWYVSVPTLLYALAGILLMSALAGFLAWIAIGRPLKWIETIQTELAETSADPRRRVTVPVHQAEIGRLAETINETLDRLEAQASCTWGKTEDHERDHSGQGGRG